ncbi:1-deoxy-D-xylulose-5-phosphate reductoisomerase [Catenulispora sp. EB89]|uniref:1-deoxy-D-xylulose-5-phosphate reductoisomerase n=1 Tax=Catenulispora sp. EB89 TaxID=3156257 RepID=UPI0035144D15
MDRPRQIVILGSTGSIGTQALDVARRTPEHLQVVGLAAGGGDPALLARQALDCGARVVGVADVGAVPDLRLALRAEAAWRAGALARAGSSSRAAASSRTGSSSRTASATRTTASPPRGASSLTEDLPEIVAGPQAATELAAMPCHTVLNAIAGAAGLPATLAALRAGHVLALANKESLIIGGDLVTGAARPGQIVPVDSEHSALAQCLRGGTQDEMERLILTASGGPFRGRRRDELAHVTPEQALAHPTWSMGPLVTVNSATLVNKGLEVIEAHLLFDVPLDRIAVVVHPQSIVHSMVEYRDGSTIAQAGPPDMRLPIALALGWPHRIPGAAPPLDWSTAARWEFFPLDDKAFPAVRLAKQAAAAGGTSPAAFNGANEQCVAAFLAGQIPFPAIVDTVERVLAEHDSAPGELTLDTVLDADHRARVRARELTA